ncbi:PREDICTED: C-_U-editing enzyme APOBEC-1 [Dipodomys ordii]|uniref:C->U-editing enzyme APOBEC-1 n=1 Tax=Dipodomys ordii TaxID=10020 RepID=A0A1S3FTE2_DIPOR|nr:PREDICTED: C->U-editing enzyme APOBEC-1 [Dipodomys ordii]
MHHSARLPPNCIVSRYANAPWTVLPLPLPPTEAPATGDDTLRRRIEPWEFEAFFNPQELRREACLLYQITWSSHKVWRETAKNTVDSHVEVNFIQNLTAGRYCRPSTRCSILWFLSWSPCSSCSKAIRLFLSQHPGVSLVIYVARLFQHMDPQNRQGLRELIHSGVTIQVMRPQEYDYCWKNFVNYPPGQEEHWPRYPVQCMTLYNLELYCIIHNLPPCVRISKQRQSQLAFFSLGLENVHYQRIPPPLLLLTGLVFVFPWK